MHLHYKGIVLSPENQPTFQNVDTPVDFQRTAKRYIPEDRILHKYPSDNLKSYIMLRLFLSLIYNTRILSRPSFYSFGV
jgi:hypothetical protein